MNGPWILPAPTVGYTPPATVTVDATPVVNFGVNFAVYAAFTTYDYIGCLT
jgi:hypothetical protein